VVVGAHERPAREALTAAGAVRCNRIAADKTDMVGCRMWRCAWLLVLAFGVCAPVAAQDVGFWSFLTPGTALPRCLDSSLAHRDAGARLEQLDAYIDRLSDSTDVAIAIGNLYALLKSECFLPAAETDRIPKPDSTIALKRWWRDGGHEWFASYLKLPMQGDVGAPRPYVAVQPDVRRTLAFSIQPGHPLRPLVCPVEDSRCGVETVGWIQRAESAFDTHRATHLYDDIRVFQSSLADLQTPYAIAQRCAADPTSPINHEQYQRWRDCIDAHRPKTSALPLGRIKAPSDGWLLVSGRRGHYDFCDTTAAYDLATGAAFVHESCSSLLSAPGRVDTATADSRRSERVRWGRLSVDNVREAMWMMLLQEESEPLQIRAEWYPLPSDLVPETVARASNMGLMFGSSSVNTAQTILTWRWVPTRGPEIGGSVIWPMSYNAAEDHAATLLAVAELSLVEGCVPRRAPSESVLGLPEMRVNHLDAPPDNSFYRRVQTAYKQWARAQLCRR
jgi:hypothetical protein